MKVLIISNNFHHKNKEGIEKILNFLKYDYKYGNEKDITNYDIIYSPGLSINTSKYPNKKFIFGPHFSVFPNNKLTFINNIHNNGNYIQPSEWASQVWRNMGVEKYLPIKNFPFPVNTERFKPLEKVKKSKVFIYFKRRKPEELEFIEIFLREKNIEYKIFNYGKKYREEEYLNYLQQSKYGIIVDAHESQGFAIEEALSCDVPLLVWNVYFMSQEYNSRYPNIPCSNIAYWDKRCGEYFYEKEEFKNKYVEFISKLDTYKPREYIMENLSVEKCAKNFINLINN